LIPLIRSHISSLFINKRPAKERWIKNLFVLDCYVQFILTSTYLNNYLLFYRSFTLFLELYYRALHIINIGETVLLFSSAGVSQYNLFEVFNVNLVVWRRLVSCVVSVQPGVGEGTCLREEKTPV